MVLKKSKSENSTLFIDAGRECIKVTNNNKLTDENISKIVDSYTSRKNKKYFSKLIPNGHIADQEYNLSVSTYIQQEDKREKVDIKALNAEIEKIVKRENVLRAEIAKIIAEIEGGESQ
jgi:type I restriction enzyme M protein